MDIHFTCPNGHKLKVKDSLAGKKGKCPKCGAAIRVPEPAPAPDDVPLEPLGEDSPLGASPEPGPLDDPLAGGGLGLGLLAGDLSDSDAFGGSAPASATPALLSSSHGATAASAGKTAKPSSGSPRPAWMQPKIFWPAVGGAGLLGMGVLIMLVLWMGGGDKEPAPSQVAQTPAAPATAVPTPAPEQPPTVAPQPETPKPAAAPQQPSPPAPPPPDLPVTRLAEPATAFAFDPEKGALAAVHAGSAKLSLYPETYLTQGTGTVVGPVAAGKMPVCVTFKRCRDRSFFVVGDMDDAKLRVFDAATLQAAGTIDIGVGRVTNVYGVESPESPYLFYCGFGANESVQKVRGFRANLSNLTDDGVAVDRAFECVPSARGSFLYMREPTIQTWHISFRLSDEPIPLTRRLKTYSANSLPFVPDSYERCVLAGELLYSADLETPLAKFAFSPKCFLPGRPFVAGLTKTEVCMASMNSGDTVGRVVAPAGALPEIPPQGSPGTSRVINAVFQHSLSPKEIYEEVRLFPDPARDRLLLAYRDGVTRVPLDRFSLPDEPLLAATVAGPATVALGRSYSASVQAAGSIGVRLSEAPEGMTLDNAKLTWTPTDRQVGDTKVTLELSQGGLTAQQPLHLQVVRPFIACSFPAAYIELSEDGRYAVVRGGEDAMNEGKGGKAAELDRVALLDLTSRQVLAERKFDSPVLDCGVDSHYVYVTHHNLSDKTGALLALSHKDLSEVKRFPIRMWDASASFFVVDVRTYEDKYLIADEVWDLPDLEPATSPFGNPFPRMGMRSFQSCFRRLGDRRLLDGVVYDSQYQDAQLVWGFRPFSRMFQPGGFSEQHLSPWGLTKMPIGNRAGYSAFRTDWDANAPSKSPSFQLLAGGGPHEKWRVIDSRLHDDAPLVFEFRMPEGWGGMLEMAAYSPVDGTVFVRYPIARAKANQSGGLFAGAIAGRSPVDVQGRMAATVVNGVVYAISLDGVDFAAAVKPPRFEPRQTVFLIADKKNLTLSHKILDGTPPYRQVDRSGQPLAGGFQSQDGSAEVQVDVTSPAVTDTAFRFVSDLIDSEATSRKSATPPDKQPRKAGPRDSPELEVLRDYKKWADKFFRRVAGKPPKGVPAPVPVTIFAKDASDRMFSLSYWVFLDLPSDRFQSQFSVD